MFVGGQFSAYQNGPVDGNIGEVEFGGERDCGVAGIDDLSNLIVFRKVNNVRGQYLEVDGIRELIDSCHPEKRVQVASRVYHG